MRIVGVIDIQKGRAVQARGGDRGAYEPVDRAAGMPVGGDADALARVYVEALGVPELYVADLDAIQDGIDAFNRVVVRDIVALGFPVWTDAGVSSLAQARTVLATGASRAIVGLETLTSFSALREICDTFRGGRIAFSLDLRNGVPVAMPNVVDPGSTPADIAVLAAAAGVEAIIVLDLGHVGMETGVDLPLLASLRRALPTTELFVGGGVRGESDLAALSSAGCDGALMATALLTGAVRV